MSTKAMKVEVVHTPSFSMESEKHTYECASQVAPPSEKFPYWTIWYTDNEEKAVKFISSSGVETLTIEGGEENYEQFGSN